MPTVLPIWILAFFAGATLFLALAEGVRRLRRRRPELTTRALEALGRGDASGLFDALCELVAREVVRDRFRGLRRRVERDLVHAGRSEPGAAAAAAARRFVAAGLLQAAGLAVGSALVFLLLFGRPLVVMALLLGTGHFVWMRPSGLHADAEERQNRIRRRLPWAIDLAVLVLGAGGTLREALGIAADGDDPLARELTYALERLDSGSTLGGALTASAERSGVDELAALAAAIRRGEETGAPMAAALATQAETFRFQRLQRAEKLAVEAPIKMMFPNVLIMIAVLLIVLGPALLSLAGGGLLS